jgi:trimethylamine--corrinoid protein Co-methyltransferase
MPLTGATSPISLIGSIVQHAAECLSGITIHQLANPGAPIVWGGAPALFDMRFGTTSIGAAETALIVSGYAQIGKHLNFPTHAYLVATDAKSLDSQSGMESGASALIGILSGINMVSGAGMLDSLACQSLEKLVLDAEAIAMAKRYLEGIKLPDTSLSLEYYENFSFPGNFLQHPLTRDRYREELYMPTKVIDRDTLRSWKETGRSDSFSRAHEAVLDLLQNYQLPHISTEMEHDLSQLVLSHARQAGMDELPGSPKI